MRRIAFFSSIILILLTLGACCKKKAYCTGEGMHIAFVGYNRSQVRQIKLKRYKQWNITDKALDSATLVYNGSAVVNPDPDYIDTLWLSDYISNSSISSITQGNDWKIEIPGAGAIYTITDIKGNGKKSVLVSCGDETTTCTEGITQYNVGPETRWSNALFFYGANFKL